MTGTAVFIATVREQDTVIQEHYRLDHPLDGHQDVVVSATEMPDFSGLRDLVPDMHTHETLIFPADHHGKIINYGDLAGHREGMDTALALRYAGYDQIIYPV